MLDDIYFLGVLFLELALWRSFVLPGQTQGGTFAWQMDSVLVDGAGPSAKILPFLTLKKRFMSLAKKEAARSMGPVVVGLIFACVSLPASYDGSDCVPFVLLKSTTVSVRMLLCTRSTM